MKTLRNMWIVVTVFNPRIAILALAFFQSKKCKKHQQSLLAFMVERSGG